MKSGLYGPPGCSAMGRAGAEDQTRVGPEDRTHRVFDDGAELVVHPAAMKFAGGDEADHSPLDGMGLEAGEPGLPSDGGDPAAQRPAKLLPLRRGFCLHLCPPRSEEPTSELQS